MSTTTLCHQRVQHPFNPKVVEPWQIQLLFPSRSVSSQPESCNEGSMKNSCKNGYLGGWSFLQSLSNQSQTPQINTDQVYAKKSKSAGLSEKSLEMCTESLGSESGSSISENGEDDIISTRSMGWYRRKRMSRAVVEFPPPLSTMRSQVESVREDGRLVIKAVSVTDIPQSCFMAERRDGTLKLRFVHGGNNELDDDDDIMEGEYLDEIENKCGNVRNEMEGLDGLRIARR